MKADEWGARPPRAQCPAPSLETSGMVALRKEFVGRLRRLGHGSATLLPDTMAIFGWIEIFYNRTRFHSALSNRGYGERRR